ncbi:hypothetical protein ACTJIL_06395 [Luteimonas sp. 22616]|uniref:hypothetical protein n=1 Tax=Luteimonas sp. 22616 TaxID=3453951 RepID=UPI003F8468AB
MVGGTLPRDRVDDDRRARQRIDDQRRLSREQQERRIREERQRAERYRQERRDWQRDAERRAHRLQQQRRMAQYRYQQQYYDRLRQQQVRWNARQYNSYNDPYYYTPDRYRYSYGGSWHRTNQYGADLIRQAINYGYREGLNAGRADRQDGWRNDYRNSYAYLDANYGYNGYYIPQGEYNYYFRQGFQRGYDDGYHSRYRYGHRDDDGNYAILAAILAAVVGFQLLD